MARISSSSGPPAKDSPRCAPRCGCRVPVLGHHAASSYSWSNPPSRSRRRTSRGDARSRIRRSRWPGRPHRRGYHPQAFGAERRVERPGEKQSTTFCCAGRHCLANDGACWSKTPPAPADCTRQRPPSTSRPGSLAHSSPHSISRSFPSAVFARLNGQLRANGPALPLAIGCGKQTAV
jgi:hypothetical protein